MNIILGSQSRGRREVLEKMGIRFEVMPSDIDEKTIRHEDPATLTLMLARAKTAALLPRITKPALLICSDQVVVFDGAIREKPENREEALMFLRGYSPSGCVETVTAVVVTNTATGHSEEGVDVARIWFRAIPTDIIVKYIDTGEAYIHGGGFDHEHELLAPFVVRIDGEPERSEEHTSELQSQFHLVCRLLL